MNPSLLVTLASDMRIHTERLRLPVKTNADFPDLGLRAALLGADARFSEELPPIDPGDEKLRVWMVRDGFRCHYFMGLSPDREQIWLLGPYLTEDMSLAEINHRYEKLGLKNVDIQYLRQYYHTLPHIRDENLMYSIVHNHCVETYGANRFEILYWEMSLTRMPRVPEKAAAESPFQQDALEYIYFQEKTAMSFVSRGNHHGAVSAIKKLERKGLESRTTSTIRDMKNFCIVFNTLCRVAAREGGVRPVDIDRYSREASIRIENASSIRELLVIREEMLKTYCALVQAVRKQVCSPVVQQAADLVEAGFSRRITLGEVAAGLNLSPNYLSLRFKKETGKSFSEYLTDTRMACARQLLTETELPVTAVAAECGIPDSNYFSRLFHRREKMTPRDYRAQYRSR